jgi:hypothetical protein
MGAERWRIWRRAACYQVSTTLIETAKIRILIHLSKGWRHALYAMLGPVFFSVRRYITNFELFRILIRLNIKHPLIKVVLFKLEIRLLLALIF